MAVTHNEGVLGRFEPELSHTFLPGCRQCGGAHPLARRGYQGPPDHCPDCDALSVAPGPTLSTRGSLAGIAGFFANTLLGLGRWIGRIAGRI